MVQHYKGRNRYHHKYTRKAFRASQCKGISVWGSFSGAGAGTLHFLPKKMMMRSEHYIPILEEEVVPTMASHGCSHYLQDKAPCHVSKQSMQVIEVRINQMVFLRLSTIKKCPHLLRSDHRELVNSTPIFHFMLVIFKNPLVVFN